MEKIKETHIIVEDHYGDECFGDSCNLKEPGGAKRGPTGFVEIHEVNEKGNKKLVAKSNLVVYLGREDVAQRIVDVNTGIPGKPTKDEFICWLGLGEGGVSGGDPFDPLPPVNNDDDLYSEVPVSVVDPNCGDYRTGTYYKLPFTLVSFEQDTANDDRFLIIVITITVGGQHANGYQLSEAGLFTAASRVPGVTSLGPFHIFSRVTFPAIVKTSDRQLVFSWYIYV
jgi:hypothetical protein